MIIGSIFSGGPDGIALGVQLETLGRVAWHAEIDEAASAVLAAHWRCPNLGDVTAIDWATVEPVDALVGGFPCQDVSVAGKGAGIDGERSGLWREFVRAIRALRPRFVFVENVPALLVRGFGRVAADLAACGYRFAWTRLGSDDVGGCHRRKRMFILATPDADGAGLRDAQQRLSGRWPGGVCDEGRTEPLDHGEAPPDAAGERWQVEGEQLGERAFDDKAGQEPTDANRKRHHRPAAQCAKAGRGLTEDGRINAPDATIARLEGADERQAQQRELARPDSDSDRIGLQRIEAVDGSHRRGAGASGVSGGDSEVGGDHRPAASADGTTAFELNPAFVEWMMGFPEGWTAMARRRDRLRMLGNAAQPQVVMAAWRGLMERLDQSGRASSAHRAT